VWPAELQRLGLKVTQPRIKILECFEREKDKHFSAEAIYQRLCDNGEEIGLATVYRVLTQFEAIGLLKRHHFEDDYFVYELNQGEHHDHLVCTSCGDVREFMDKEIEERQAKIAKNEGFKMIDHALNIYGICSACQI